MNLLSMYVSMRGCLYECTFQYIIINSMYILCYTYILYADLLYLYKYYTFMLYIVHYIYICYIHVTINKQSTYVNKYYILCYILSYILYIYIYKINSICPNV